MKVFTVLLVTSRIVLRPPIHELPSTGSQWQPIQEGGEQVVALLFREMHQEVNVYRCFAAAARHCYTSEGGAGATSSSSSTANTEPGRREAPCLRSWFALELHPAHDNVKKCPKQFKPRDPSGVICSALGDPSSRASKIRAAAEAIGVEQLSTKEEGILT